MVAGGLESAWDGYLNALETAPLLTRAVTAGLLFPMADGAAQVLENGKREEKEDVDVARLARFAIFGFFVQAPWNSAFYEILDRLLPPTEDPLSIVTVEKLFVDQGLQAPVFTVVIFLVLGLLEGKTLDAIKGQLIDDYVPTIKKNWALWIPASAVNLAFVPPVLRVLYTNVVFFCWCIVLSLIINEEKE